MRRAVATAMIGMAVTTAAVGVTTASGASGSATETFTLIGHETAFHIVDNGPKGDSANDIGTMSGTLFRDGRHVGRYLADCIQTDGSGHSLCRFVLALPGGLLVLETGYGTGVNGDRLVHEAIVGGTGTYAGATGYTDGTETGRTTIKEVIHLLH